MPGPADCGGLRKELQRAYDTYKQSELHYKVFALKHESNRWDGWYTWGYNDLDGAILDAVMECNRGGNVKGRCQVYALGNEVVVGLKPLELQAKIEEYRIFGMVNRAYPKPSGRKLVGLGISGNGQYYAGVAPGDSASRLFIYDTNDALWKHTFELETDIPMHAGRSFSLGYDGKAYAFARARHTAGDKGASAIVVKGWDEELLAEIPLAAGAFWNDGCGVALSPFNKEVAVCVDDGVMTRVVRYEVDSGKKLGEINSDKLKGKFDGTLEYSPDGQFLLIQGGRYQFDWVLKKKSQEAEMVWLFSMATGRLQKSLAFPLGPGKKGAEDICFTVDGHDILVTTTSSIILYSQGGKKVFPRQSGVGTVSFLSPHGVLAVVDGDELFRFNVVGGSLVPIDFKSLNSSQYMLGFDRTADLLTLVGDQDMVKLPAFRQMDLQSIGLCQDAKKLFGLGKYNEAVAILTKIVAKNPNLPAGFSAYNLYTKYPDAPLAHFGLLYGAHIKKICDVSDKVSRFGFGYVKNSQSGLFFTTVKRINPATSVAHSSIQVGDRITHFNGKPVVLATQIDDLLVPLPPGTRVDLNYMRDGRIFKESVVTETGFKDSGKVAHVLLTLFDYGQLAAQAGHPGLTRSAAVRLRKISGRYPSSFRMDLVEKLAVSLEALAFSVEGDIDASFDLLGQSAPHPFQFRLFNPLVWGYFYRDRARLAEAIGVPENKLPQFDGVMLGTPQDFPDLTGLMIPAVTPPPLLR